MRLELCVLSHRYGRSVMSVFNGIVEFTNVPEPDSKLTAASYFEFAAIFFTMANTSLRSLSLRLAA